MPEEHVDQATGAILFKKTEEENAIIEMQERTRKMEQEISYIARFLKRYEPVFEDLLNKRV